MPDQSPSEERIRPTPGAGAGAGGPPLRSPARLRYATARLPRNDRAYGSGLGLATVGHVLVILAFIVTQQVVSHRAIGMPGEPGGGGGGSEIHFIGLAPAPAPASAAAPRAEQVAAPPPEPEPVAEDELLFPLPELARVEPPEDSPISLESLGLGAGKGQSSGPGSGGGIGSGEGTGIGAGVGPGTGGDGGAVLAPEWRVVVFPFEEAPASIKGREFQIHFWVDRRGRVTKVEISPKIEDNSFRKKLMERMLQWVFYPARTFSGSPVEGEDLVSITF